MKKLVIPNALPGRKWKEMTRQEATNFVLNIIGRCTSLLVCALVAGGAVGWFLKTEMDNDLVPPQLISNYYQVTKEMPSKAWLDSYSSEYIENKPILSIEEIAKSLEPIK